MMNEFLRGNRLAVDKVPWSNSVGFVLFARQGDRIAHSTNVDFFVPEKEHEGMRIEPTFYLQAEEVQELMDSLWQIGFRPSEGTGSAGALAATQKHLEDMRRLVFENQKERK